MFFSLLKFVDLGVLLTRDITRMQGHPYLTIPIPTINGLRPDPDKDPEASAFASGTELAANFYGK